MYLFLIFFLNFSQSICSIEFVVLHNNDLRARFEETTDTFSVCGGISKCFGGFARISTVIKEERALAQRMGYPIFYFNAGDTYEGSTLFTFFRHKVATDMLNMLTPDAINIGNIEFNYGLEGLLPFVNNVKCPIVSSNIDHSKEVMFDFKKLKKSTILYANGTKVGIIGYTITNRMKEGVDLGNFLFEDELVAVNREAQNLHNEGVQIIIALGHSGLATDKKIAANVPLLDVIVGGHHGQLFWNGPQPEKDKISGPYPLMVAQPNGKMVAVLRTRSFGKYLGKIRLVFNSMGQLIESEGQPILLSDKIKKDPEVVALLNEYNVKLEKQKRTIVARTKIPLATLNCMKGECVLGNLWADSLVHERVQHYASSDFWTDTPIALINAGRFNKGTLSGGITYEDVENIIPLEGALTIFELEGQYLKLMFEQSVYNGLHPKFFLQVSGLKIIYDMHRKPGDRVVSLKARCARCDTVVYEDLVETRLYRIISSNLLATGISTTPIVKTKAVNLRTIGQQDVQCFLTYIKKKRLVFAELSGRILVSHADTLTLTVTYLNILVICFI